MDELHKKHISAFVFYVNVNVLRIMYSC